MALSRHGERAVEDRDECRSRKREWRNASRWTLAVRPEQAPRRAAASPLLLPPSSVPDAGPTLIDAPRRYTHSDTCSGERDLLGNQA
jgi:hypothetical protein